MVQLPYLIFSGDSSAMVPDSGEYNDAGKFCVDRFAQASWSGIIEIGDQYHFSSPASCGEFTKPFRTREGQYFGYAAG